MKIKKTIYALIGAIAFLGISSPALAGWACGIERGLPPDIMLVNCERSYGNAGRGVMLTRGITFNTKNAEGKYNAAICEGRQFKAGEWRSVMGSSRYQGDFNNANLPSNVEQFQAQFVVEWKNGNSFYKSPWLSCK